jgi:hypothetical protein
MAVADAGGQTINNSNNAASYAALAFTPSANAIVLVAGAITNTAATLGLTDSQGITYTKLVDQVYGTSHKMGLWVATSLAANSSDTITITNTGDSGTGCVAFLRYLTGGRTVPNFYRQFNFATGGAGTTPAVPLTFPVNTNNAVFAWCFNLTNPAGLTPPGSFAEQQDIGHTAIDMGGEYAHRLTGETGSTITWGGTSVTAWGAIVVEIYVSGQPINIPLIGHHRNQMFGS